MNHIECSARDPQGSLGTVCILWIHRWYLLSKSFEPMNMGVDLLSQMPSPREETEAEWFSETNNLNEGSTIDHSINSSCNYSSYFYHFMIKTMHFNPYASFLAPVRELRSRSFRLWRNEDWIRKNSGNHIICHQKERSTTKSETPSFSFKQNGSIYSQHQERKLSASNGNHPQIAL